ncbi:MAG: hypothetical protein ACRDRN_21505 [Sciscionella sp.]
MPPPDATPRPHPTSRSSAPASGAGTACDSRPAPHDATQASAPSWLPAPTEGRIFTTTRIVRGTEITPAGRLRLDTIARYLQDVAEDNSTDTG